jgi:hypothetical protein
MHTIDTDVEQRIKISFGNELLKQRSKRSAVIPYVFRLDKTTGYYEPWVLLAKHKKSGEITDFGGGVKITETDLTASFRELHEETRMIFWNEIDIDMLKSCVSVTRPRHEKIIKPTNTRVLTEAMSVIFLPLDEKWFDIAVPNFMSSACTDDEISEIMWVRGCDILQRTSKNYKMWGFVRKFYHEALSDDLCKMLYVKWVTN